MRQLRQPSPSRPSLPTVDPDLGAGQTTVAGRTVGRFLGALTTVASLLALLWTLLPHEGREGDGLVRAMVAVGLAAGLLMLLGAIDRAPPWVPQVAIGLLQVVISVGYLAPGVADNDLRLLFVWAVPAAAFFFSPRSVVGHGLVGAVCLAGCLSVQDEPTGVLLRVWLLTVGTSTALAVVVGVGVGAARRSRRALRHLALHDALSGLPNRVLFERRLLAALRDRDAHGGAVHVLLVDLDHFKLVNDTYGHHAGDTLITVLAPRLAAVVGPGSTVARMGGDEFAVVLPDPAGDRLAGVVASLPDAWAEPVVLEGALVPASATVGVVSCTGPGRSAEGLLRDADVALYRAKQTRRGSVRRFDESLRVEVERSSRLGRELRHALDRDELSVVYQPVVELGTGRTVAAEALLRWHHPELGPVPPSEFVPLAEDNGLVVAIGRFVLDRVALDLASWRATGTVGDQFAVAVNVSVRQLEERFPEELAALLARHGVPPQAVTVEVTESVLIDGTSRSGTVLARLRHAGNRVALDDFGTGYSSLSYLQRLPMDTLKIDRSFVGELDGERPSTALVQAVVDLARSLGMDVVAEGVETLEQECRLRDLGVERGQGWLFARPMPALAFARHMAVGAGRV